MPTEHTLAENLIRLQEAKEDIADAIVEMGGTASSTDGLEDMPDAIRTIEANPTLITKSITANGTYDAEDDNADGYNEVTVAVPNTYAVGDEGKVVSGGVLVSQTSTSILTNGTYDTTTNNSVVVNIADQPSTVKTITAEYLTLSYPLYVRQDSYWFYGVDQCCVWGYFGIQLSNKNSSSSGYRYIGEGTTLLTLTGINAPVNRTAHFIFSKTGNPGRDGSSLTIDSNANTNEIYIKTASQIALANGGTSSSSTGFWGIIDIWFT